MMNSFNMEESDPKIKRRLLGILTEDTAIIAIIPPYKPFELTPSVTPEIRSQEASDLNEVISMIRENGIKKLFVLVDSLIGAAQSPISIVQEMMGNFSHIIVFVPHTTTNGGNMMVSIGDKTVMGAAEEMVDRLKYPDQDEITPFKEVSEILNDGLIRAIEDRELWGLMKDWIRAYIKKADGYIIRFLLPD